MDYSSDRKLVVFIPLLGLEEIAKSSSAEFIDVKRSRIEVQSS